MMIDYSLSVVQFVHQILYNQEFVGTPVRPSYGVGVFCLRINITKWKQCIMTIG